MKHKRFEHNLTSDDLQLLLECGNVLSNNYGHTVHLGNNKKQLRSNPNRKRNYKFSNPHYWNVIGRGNHKPTRWEKLLVFISRKVL